jgi:hypothetical protein
MIQPSLIPYYASITSMISHGNLSDTNPIMVFSSSSKSTVCIVKSFLLSRMLCLGYACGQLGQMAKCFTKGLVMWIARTSLSLNRKQLQKSKIIYIIFAFLGILYFNLLGAFLA